MENYQIIALQIIDVRSILNGVYLKKPEDASILRDFESLATFVIENFTLPPAQKEFIYKNLGVDGSVINLAEELIRNNSEIKEGFDLELKLRGIESYFSWGKPENIDLPKLTALKYLIAKLHCSIGDKAMKKILIQANEN